MDLGDLVQTGAANIVAAMASDAWEGVRLRLARLLGGDDSGRQNEAAAELAQSRERFVSFNGDERAVAGIEAELRGQLREWLRREPTSAAEFRVLVEGIQRQVPAAGPSTVRQHGAASRGGVVMQAGRDINGIRPK